jgi:Glycosyl hydrolase family 71
MKVAPRKLFYVSTLLVAFCVCSASANAERVVFAHFMLANQDYVSADAPSEAVIASYEHEIREAQAIGIDGFALNAGGWFKEPRYIKRASEMFEAAYRLNSNFKLMFSADMCCSNDAEDVEDMIRRFASSPRYSALDAERIFEGALYVAEDGQVVIFGAYAGFAGVGGEEPRHLFGLGERHLVEHDAAQEVE